MSTPFHGPIRVGPFAYNVSRDATSQVALENEEAVGLTIPDALEIHISNALSPDRERATLLHEIIHACADLADLGDTSSEEDWASRLGPLLLQVMRDNPRLIAWVLEDA